MKKVKRNSLCLSVTSVNWSFSTHLLRLPLSLCYFFPSPLSNSPSFRKWCPCILNLFRPYYSICPSFWDNAFEITKIVCMMIIVRSAMDVMKHQSIPHTYGIVKMSSYGGWFLRDSIHLVNPLGEHNPTTIVPNTMNPTGFAEPEAMAVIEPTILRYLCFELWDADLFEYYYAVRMVFGFRVSSCTPFFAGITSRTKHFTLP